MQGKHKGSKFEYEAQRDANLLKVYKHYMASSDGTATQMDIYKAVVLHESERFWVSEVRADIIVCNMMRNYHATIKNMYPLKRKMYKEIYQRTMRLLEENPKLSRMDAVVQVLAGPAPEFYITPGSAKVILCKMKKKEWYQKRKQKLRHLF